MSKETSNDAEKKEWETWPEGSVKTVHAELVSAKYPAKLKYQGGNTGTGLVLRYMAFEEEQKLQVSEKVVEAVHRAGKLKRTVQELIAFGEDSDEALTITQKKGPKGFWDLVDIQVGHVGKSGTIGPGNTDKEGNPLTQSGGSESAAMEAEAMKAAVANLIATGKPFTVDEVTAKAQEFIAQFNSSLKAGLNSAPAPVDESPEGAVAIDDEVPFDVDDDIPY